MDTIVAKVSGATQVARMAVSETMTIKDEALDKINAIKTESTKKKGDQAIKQITADTKTFKKRG